MSLPSKRREKEVRLSVFDNEPLARLAEQRLRLAGIPCLSKSLQGGPGLWGSAYNLPHALYVYESDEMRAREALGLTPLEIIERGREGLPQGQSDSFWSPFKSSGNSSSKRSWLLFAVLGLIVAWVILWGVFSLFRQSPGNPFDGSPSSCLRCEAIGTWTRPFPEFNRT